MADLAEFDAFVVACSPRLLRTAYLLVGERHLAQDLVQTALAKSWFAWKRIQGNPEPYVRKVMVTTAEGASQVQAAELAGIVESARFAADD